MSIAEAFKQIAEERKVHEWLHPLLLEHLYQEREGRPTSPDMWLDASGVPTICPRAIVIVHRLQIPTVRQVDPRGRWFMDRGTALHSMFQEMWLGPLGWILGGWRCLRCAKVWGVDEGGWARVHLAVPMPDRCDSCDYYRFRFLEPYIHDRIYRVRGKTDGVLRLPACVPEIMDLKTTGNLDAVRRSPKPDHVAQLHWYMGPIKYRRGRLIYLDPGAKNLEEAIVEHKVPFEPELWHAEREKVRGIREALKEESRPVPRCPYDGKGPYGECSCVEMEDVWKRSRNRPLS